MPASKKVHYLEGGIVPVKKAYDLSAPYYDDWKWQKFWRSHEYPIVKETFDRYRRGRSSDISMLDIGCGTGWYLNQLEYLCRERIGLDISSGMIAVAKRRLKSVTLIEADAQEIPFGDGRFDAVLCTRVISHLPEIRSAIYEMSRLVRPGGLLMVSNIDDSHEYEYTRLPVESHFIFADTFKHERDTVVEMLESSGFIRDKVRIIATDGSISLMRRRTSKKPAVGWIGAWRKAATAAVEAKG